MVKSVGSVTFRRNGAGVFRHIGASFRWGKRASRRGQECAALPPFATFALARRRPELRGTVGLAVEDEAVGVVAQPIERCRGEQAICGEGLIPLGEVEVGGDDGRGRLVALGDEIVQILVCRRSKRFQAEVVDDQERHAGERGELPVVGADRACGVQTRGEACAGGEDDVGALAHGAVAEGLGEMGLLPVPQGPTMSTGMRSAR